MFVLDLNVLVFRIVLDQMCTAKQPLFLNGLFSTSCVTAVEPKRYTPHKYTLPHIRASFGASGQLVKVLPNQPSDGQPALVVIQELVDVFGDERTLDDIISFPGPLVK